MKSQRITFQNSAGLELSGKVELPVDQHPHNFVLFAHCFTCNKNLLAIKNISRALTAAGYGVLRFDFTGLGDSDGDFADTTFSHNVQDLIDAAGWLAQHHTAPTVLVGHSLGGAAAILAGCRLDSVKAVCTIGSPSHPQHVQHLIKDHIDVIRENGEATIDLSGRPFRIKKDFLDDLTNQPLGEALQDLNKGILVMHSPQDRIVEIKNAEEIYHAARHPKSFISLDGADHLLSQKQDSYYVGQVIAGWAGRYVTLPEPDTFSSNFQVVAQLDKGDGYTTNIRAGKHYMIADEPSSVGGSEFGPSPYDYVSAGLAACTSMTIRMYADRKNWDVSSVETHISYGKQHATDCLDCDNETSKIDTFTRHIVIEGSLNEEQKSRLMQVADRCPVHRTLHSETQTLNKFEWKS